ncbi:TIGR04086 family membrane protein [Chloroflexus sp.]|uniref:TIGR04086 family membrane protein n=1 Tax=Chloroflexus sp. TaxID=1904827 RepID=UPI00404A9B82
MSRSDRLDDMHWGVVALGVAIALAMQVAITLLVLNPLAITLSWTAVVLVELCIAAGAFVSGWRARRAALLNGLMAGLISAVISLLATVIQTPAQVDMLNVLFLFVTFGVMGLLGGVLGGYSRTRRAAQAHR